MAFGGRLKSTLPLFSKLLRSDALSTPTRSVAHRALVSQFPRRLATAAADEEINVKVPLPMFGVDGTYASALYRVSVKYSVLEKVESELLDFIKAAKEAPIFTAFTRDPTVRQEVRLKAMEAICAEAKFCDQTRNFLLAIAQNGHFKILDRILKKFRDLTLAHRGEVEVIVTTATPIEANEEKEVMAMVKENLPGKTIILQKKVDPRILGGLMIEYENKLLDMSIRMRARQFERFLREEVNFDELFEREDQL